MTCGYLSSAPPIICPMDEYRLEFVTLTINGVALTITMTSYTTPESTCTLELMVHLCCYLLGSQQFDKDQTGNLMGLVTASSVCLIFSQSTCIVMIILLTL